MTGPFRRRRSAAPQKVLSENLSPISLSATEPSPSLSGGGALWARCRGRRKDGAGRKGWSRSSAAPPRGFPHVPGAPRLFLPRLAACFCFPGWAGPADGGGIWEGRSAPAESRLASRRSREGGREDRERRAWFIHRREEKRWGQAAGAAPALLQRENKTHPPAKQRCLGSEMHFPVRLEPGFYLNFFFFFLLPH